MAQYNRPPKKKAKGPDEFISFFDHLVRYFMVHRNKLIILVGVAVLGFVAYGIFLYQQSNRVHDFAALYQEALVAPPEEALSTWQDLLDKNPPLDLKEVVAMQIGGIYAKDEDWTKAAEYFHLAAQAKSQVLRYPGQWSYADALANAGKSQEAMVIYQGMADDPENPFKDYGRLGMARLMENTGQVESARKILEALTKEGAEVIPAVQTAARDQLLLLALTQAGTPNKTESAPISSN